MDHSTILAVASVPTTAVLALVAARALISSAYRAKRASTLGRLAEHTDVFDWALHFSMGLLVLSVISLVAVPRFHDHAWFVGLLTGLIASGVAFSMTGPPVGAEESQSLIDSRHLTISAAVHLSLAMVIAYLISSMV